MGVQRHCSQVCVSAPKCVGLAVLAPSHVPSFRVSIHGMLKTMLPAPCSDAALELKGEKAIPVVACKVHPGIAVSTVSSLARDSGCGNSAPWGKGRGRPKGFGGLTTLLSLGSQHSVSVLKES